MHDNRFFLSTHMCFLCCLVFLWLFRVCFFIMMVINIQHSIGVITIHSLAWRLGKWMMDAYSVECNALVFCLSNPRKEFALEVTEDTKKTFSLNIGLRPNLIYRTKSISLRSGGSRPGREGKEAIERSISAGNSGLWQSIALVLTFPEFQLISTFWLFTHYH